MQRIFSPPVFVTTDSPILGGRGVATYLSPVGGEEADIVFRNHRPYPPSQRGTSLSPPIVFAGTYSPANTHLLLDAIVDVDKIADGETEGTASVALPDGYETEGAAYWIQVRTHEAGIENTTLYRPRRIIVGQTDAILGEANLVRVIKLDGGDAQIDFEYLATFSGSQPDSFLIRKVSGAGTIADVEIIYQPDRQDFSGIVTGMTTGVTYVFRLFGVANVVETELIATITVVADADGPDAVTVTFEEET